MSPGSSDDLEEAGLIYLNTGASDIWDEEERRWVTPEIEIDCVGRAYEKRARRKKRLSFIAEAGPLLAGAAIIAETTVLIFPWSLLLIPFVIKATIWTERLLKKRWVA